MKAKVAASALIVAILSFSGHAFAAGKKVTVQGVLESTINGKGSIINAGDKEYYFDPTSKAGKKIWGLCERDKPCIVTGVINKDKIVSVSAVEKGK